MGMQYWGTGIPSLCFLLAEISYSIHICSCCFSSLSFQSNKTAHFYLFSVSNMCQEKGKYSHGKKQIDGSIIAHLCFLNDCVPCGFQCFALFLNTLSLLSQAVIGAKGRGNLINVTHEHQNQNPRGCVCILAHRIHEALGSQIRNGKV